MKRSRMMKIGAVSSVAVLALFLILKNHQKITERNPTNSLSILTSSRSRTRSPEELVSSAERRKAEEIALRRIHEDLLRRYPMFQIEYRDVPDELNGYLQLMKLGERFPKDRLPESLSEIFHEQAEWDGAKMSKWLDEHADYVAEILRIAELPDRSMKDVLPGRKDVDQAPYILVGEAAHLLSAKSRLAVESGNYEEALRYQAAVKGLGDHLSKIEASSFRTKVWARNLYSTGMVDFESEILPHLANDPDAIRSWSDALYHPTELKEDHHRTIIGDWNFLTGTVLPEYLKDYPDFDITTFRSDHLVLDDITQFYLAALESANLPIGQEGYLSFPSASDPSMNFSPENSAFIKEHDLGFAIESVMRSLHQHERNNALKAATLAASIGDEMPNDPLTGKQIIWDAEAQQAILPEP